MRVSGRALWQKAGTSEGRWQDIQHKFKAGGQGRPGEWGHSEGKGGHRGARAQFRGQWGGPPSDRSQAPGKTLELQAGHVTGSGETVRTRPCSLPRRPPVTSLVEAGVAPRPREWRSGDDMNWPSIGSKCGGGS